MLSIKPETAQYVTTQCRHETEIHKDLGDILRK